MFTQKRIQKKYIAPPNTNVSFKKSLILLNLAVTLNFVAPFQMKLDVIGQQHKGQWCTQYYTGF